MLCDQQIGFSLGLRMFLLQLTQRSLQIFYLRFLVDDLLSEAFAQVAIALHPLQSGTRQIVLFLVDGQFCFTHPFRHFVFIFFSPFFQQMLVGDGDRHLRLDLQKLILHVEDDLLDHFFRMLSLVDQVVEIGPD